MSNNNRNKPKNTSQLMQEANGALNAIEELKKQAQDIVGEMRKEAKALSDASDNLTKKANEINVLTINNLSGAANIEQRIKSTLGNAKSDLSDIVGQLDKIKKHEKRIRTDRLSVLLLIIGFFLTFASAALLIITVRRMFGDYWYIVGSGIGLSTICLIGGMLLFHHTYTLKKKKMELEKALAEQNAFFLRVEKAKEVISQMDNTDKKQSSEYANLAKFIMQIYAPGEAKEDDCE